MYTDAILISRSSSLPPVELSVDRSLASSSRNDVVFAEARLQIIFQGMHGYLNTLPPINRLPPEILATIFEEILGPCAKPPSLNGRHSDHSRVDTRPQFRLAHVCRLWHSAALGDGSLWSHIDVAYPEAAVEFFLWCASDYPLTLYASEKKATLVDRILEDHCTHIRAIYFLELSNLRATLISVEDFISPLPKASLSQLRLLVFNDAQLEVAFYLLKSLTLPEAVLLSIEGGGGRHDHDDAHPILLRLPPVTLLNATTFMEISTDVRTLLLTGYDATRTSGFLLKTRNMRGLNWSTSWFRGLHDTMSLSHITVLHIHDNHGQVLPHLLPHLTQLEELSILLLSFEREWVSVAETAATLFASLTPRVTTLVCPALRFLGLACDITHESFPYAKLQTMAARRHQRGLPLHRFVYQWNGSANSKSRFTAKPNERDVVASLAEALTPLLQPYVDSVEYRLSSAAKKLCPFVPPECWRAPGADKFWRSKLPSYGLDDLVNGDYERCNLVRRPRIRLVPEA
ncbi:hypothetical protein V8D89_007158 [Ganoderma adspersum]